MPAQASSDALPYRTAASYRRLSNVIAFWAQEAVLPMRATHINEQLIPR